MPQCAGIKRDGGRCAVLVGPGESHCYAHDPRRADERKRNASRGGRSKGHKSTGEIVAIKAQLQDAADKVLDGTLNRADAAVAAQLLNVKLRALELERKWREVEKIEARVTALETGENRWEA